MPTLDEMRRWAAGEDVPGLPPHSNAEGSPRPPAPPEKAIAGIEPGLYDTSVKYAAYRHTKDGLVVVDDDDGETESKTVKEVDIEAVFGAAGRFDTSKMTATVIKARSERKSEAEARAETHARCKYTISMDGEDALLQFGMHNGKTVMQVLEKEPSYIDWIIKSAGFKADLKEVCRSCKAKFTSKKAFEE